MPILRTGPLTARGRTSLSVDRFGIAVLAVEYHGHYQGNAVQRDAVKREAFRSANVAFLEVPADFQKADVKRAVRQILERRIDYSSVASRPRSVL